LYGNSRGLSWLFAHKKEGMEGGASPPLTPHPPAAPRPTTSSSRSARTADGGTVLRRFGPDGAKRRTITQRVVAPEDGPCETPDENWTPLGSASPRVHKVRSPSSGATTAAVNSCMLCGKTADLGPVAQSAAVQEAASAYAKSCPTCHPKGVVAARRAIVEGTADLHVCSKAKNCNQRKLVSSTDPPPTPLRAGCTHS